MRLVYPSSTISLFALRRQFAALLTLLVLSACPLFASAEPEPATEAVVSTRARLRAGAGAEHPTLATLPAGTRLSIVSDGEEFAQVNYQGKSGWIAKSLLTPVAKANAATPAAATATASAPTAAVSAPSLPTPAPASNDSAANFPTPPPTIVVSNASTTNDIPLAPADTAWWLLALVAAATGLGGFLIGYQWRERYYRKRLYGLRL